ncbi:MAG: HK97 gp10 family phage protein, partial [Aedoeadaptatus pacaensis]
ITNTAPYAPYVEFGHRIVTRDGTTIGWQDGKFMLTVSLQTVERHLDEIAGVEIERAFGRAFK